MPKITDLKSQVKNPNRISVYVDGKYAIGLGVWQIGPLGLKIGKELSADELVSLQHDADFGKLYERSLQWLAIRKRSAWEVVDYLRRKTDDEALRTAVYETLDGKGYINDAAFAKAWINNRRATKLTSFRKLRLELRAKRVEQSIIDAALTEDEVDDDSVLAQLIVKKRRISRYQDDTKLMQYLARQGFSYSDIKDALAEEA